MDRVNAILNNSDFRSALETIDKTEKTRIYCRHSYDHLLSVARIMYIEDLEKELHIDREVIYATALLHDIGRSVSNEHHAEESAKMSIHILRLAKFSDEEIDMIREAILAHREGSDSVLGGLLYRADKMSRDCYFCDASDTCKWIRKNTEVIR